MKHNFVGYHGTIKEYADNIIAEDSFHISTKSNEWLGKGIYFFVDKNSAKWWADMAQRKAKRNCSFNGDDTPKILSVIIIYCDNQYFDLDIKDNLEQVSQGAQAFFELLKSQKMGIPKFKDSFQYASFAMDLFIEKHPEIKVVSKTFLDRRSEIYFDGYMSMQKQVCAIDNSVISNIQIEGGSNGS